MPASCERGLNMVLSKCQMCDGFHVINSQILFAGVIKKLRSTAADNALNDSNNNETNKAHRYTMQLERQLRDLMAASQGNGKFRPFHFMTMESYVTVREKRLSLVLHLYSVLM